MSAPWMTHAPHSPREVVLPVTALARAWRTMETALDHLPCRQLDRIQPARLDVDAALVACCRAYDPALNGSADKDVIADEVTALRAANRVLQAENKRLAADLRAALAMEGAE
jgi:hypothetical protein